MTLNIGFYYERYRFYTADQFDQNSIRSLTVGSNIDDVTTTGTSNNTTILSSVLASLLNVTGIA